MLTVSEIESGAALVALGSEWGALIEEAPEATPFQSFEWVEPFWRHCGGGALFVLVAREGGELVGVLPVLITRTLGLRRVVFIGAGPTDYFNLVARAGREDEVRQAFLDHLVLRRDRWDVLDFAHLPAGTAWTRTPPHPGLVLRLDPCHRCPATALPATWEAFLSQAGSKLRGNIRRQRKLIAAAFDVRCDTVTGADVAPTLDAMFLLNQRRWHSRWRSTNYAQPAIQAFHHEVAAGFAWRGWLRLHRLRLDGQTRAVLYCFRLGDRVIYHNGGFDIDLARYSPGLVLMAYAVEQAIAEGARIFDFTRGQETYKYLWRAQDCPSYRLVVAQSRVRSRLCFDLTSAETYLAARAAALVPLLYGHQSAPNRLRKWTRGILGAPGRAGA